jgi:hypothetical protein
MTLSSSALGLLFFCLIYVSLQNNNVAIHQAHTDLERRCCSNTMTLQFNRPRMFPRFSFEFPAAVYIIVVQFSSVDDTPQIRFLICVRVRAGV